MQLESVTDCKFLGRGTRQDSITDDNHCEGIL